MRRILFSVILAVLLAVSASAACTIDYIYYHVPTFMLFNNYEYPSQFVGVWAFVRCTGPEITAVGIRLDFETQTGFESSRTQIVPLTTYGMASAIFWTGPCRVKAFQVTELKEIGSQTFEVGTDIPDRSGG